jgi:type II secretory pathway component PulJ
MKKVQIVIFSLLLLAAALTFTSCETLTRAFADQAGRNAADALWDR